jgi:hypothetical protein
VSEAAVDNSSKAGGGAALRPLFFSVCAFHLPPGLLTSTFLTLEVLPVLYTIWRYRQLRHSQRTGVPLETIVGAVPAWARR